jgi:probable F420-dependent oxidoreductase
MKLGVSLWATDETMSPADLAVEAEQRGFESLWLGDHTHVRVRSRTSSSVSPPEQCRFVDPFVGLATAVAATSTIGVGTAVCLVAQRDPIILAKEVASIDHLSCGRFLFGIGFGWNAKELLAHGVNPAERQAVVREKVLAMKELWTAEEAAFHGSYVSFGRSWSWPKPYQKPHPPVLIGGTGRTALRHVLEYGDGWIPLAEQGTPHMDAIRAAASAAGRDATELDVSVTAPPVTREALTRYRDEGVTRAILFLDPPCGRDDVLPRLDDWAALLPVVAS